MHSTCQVVYDFTQTYNKYRMSNVQKLEKRKGGLDSIPPGLIQQGMVNGSASKPALRQDTGYMIEKTMI